MGMKILSVCIVGKDNATFHAGDKLLCAVKRRADMVDEAENGLRFGFENLYGC